MTSPDLPISRDEKVDALLGYEGLFEQGGLVPQPEPGQAGRPRDFQGFLYPLFSGLKSIYGSARAVDAQLAYGVLWKRMRDRLEELWPNHPDRRLPEKPFRRHHWLYGREWVTGDDDILDLALDEFTRSAAVTAVVTGLFDPDGPGSLTRPDLSRVLHGDGKVVKPLYRAKRGDVVVDKQTGEMRQPRFDPDAGNHVTGSGEHRHGVKFVFIFGRGAAPHSRVLLGIAHDTGKEAQVGVDLVRRLAPHLPGAQALIWDTALRGTHIDQLMVDLGLLSICPVSAESGGRASGKPRTERTRLIETVDVRRGDGSVATCELWTNAGAPCLATFNEEGDQVLVPLLLRKVEPRGNKGGGNRFYGCYDVPDELGGGTTRIRLYTNDDDRARRLNRAEHLRAFPPESPDYKRLYGRRNDAESSNRALDDTLWLRRAGSVGVRRQLYDLIGYGLVNNAVALHRHKQARGPDVVIQRAA